MGLGGTVGRGTQIQKSLDWGFTCWTNRCWHLLWPREALESEHLLSPGSGTLGVL